MKWSLLVTCAFNNFPDSPGSSREHGGLIQAHAAHIDYVEAVHVLGRWDCITDCALVDVVCQETKTNYSKDTRIANVLVHRDRRVFKSSQMHILHLFKFFSLPGKGSWTSRPSTRWSVLNLSIRSNNSSSLMSECLRIVSLEIPVGSGREKTLRTRPSVCLYVV